MKNKNTGKRQERAIETKKKIYEAAKQLFLVKVSLSFQGLELIMFHQL